MPLGRWIDVQPEGNTLSRVLHILSWFCFDTRRVTDSLAKLFDRATSDETRTGVIKAMAGKFTGNFWIEEVLGSDAVPFLCNVVVERMPEQVADAVARMLGRYPIASDSLMEAIRRGTGRSAAVWSLGGKNAGDLLAEVASNSKLDDSVRKSANERLIAMGDQRVFDEVMRAAHHSYSSERTRAVVQLRHFPGERTIELLLRALHDGLAPPTTRNLPMRPERDEDVPLWAARSLGKLKATQAVEPLLGMLSGRFALGAAEALGEIGDRRAIEPLRAALLDEKHDSYGSLNRAFVRRAAVRSLAQIQGSDCVAVLAEAARQDSSFLVREDIAGALGDTGGSLAVETLLFLTEHLETRSTAVRSLGKIGDPRAGPKLHELLRKGEAAAVEALYLIEGVTFIDALQSLLTDRAQQKEVRAAAAVVLAKAAEQRARPILLALLTDETQQSEVRAAAATALARIGEQRALPILGRAWDALGVSWPTLPYLMLQADRRRVSGEKGSATGLPARLSDSH